MRCAAGVIMSDLHDRITRLAAEAQQRADVAGTQAAWQEGRAHGLREAAAIAAAAADTRTLQGGIRDYIETLKSRGTPRPTPPGYRPPFLDPASPAIGEAAAVAKRATWRQVVEELHTLLDADEPEEAGDE